MNSQIESSNRNPLKIESNLHNSSSTRSGQSMVDLTNTQDCRMSEKLSLIRSFSKYTPHFKASNTPENLSNLPSVKVEEPSKISGTDPNRTLEEEKQLNYVPTQPKSESKEHEAPDELQNEKDIGLDPAEKLQNEIRMEREKEAAEWNKAKASAMMSNHNKKKRIVILERQLRKINKLLSFKYFEKSFVNRKVLILGRNPKSTSAE